jgi:hypothetical protein
MLKDYKNAEKWYLQSMQKDNEPATLWNLGLIYEYGKGTVQKDLQKAISEGCIIKKDEVDPSNETRVVTLEEAVNFTD